MTDPTIVMYLLLALWRAQRLEVAASFIAQQAKVVHFADGSRMNVAGGEPVYSGPDRRLLR